MTGARQDMPGYDRYIAFHDKYMACTYYFFLKCVFITFESSISCSSHVLCMLAYSNIRKLSQSMKTWWWHYSYVPVIYLHIPLYTVIWRYMRVYVGISGCQDSRCDSSGIPTTWTRPYDFVYPGISRYILVWGFRTDLYRHILLYTKQAHLEPCATWYHIRYHDIMILAMIS